MVDIDLGEAKELLSDQYQTKSYFFSLFAATN